MEDMIQKLKETYSYSKMVFLETEKTNKTWTKIMKSILGLAAVCLFLICLILYAFLGGFPDAVDRIIENFGSQVEYSLIILAGTILLSVFVFPILFLQQAASIHKKQEEEKK